MSHGIPILGQGPAPAADSIHPQARLNVVDEVGRYLAEAKRLGLRHGRFNLVGPTQGTSAEMMLYYDALHEAGCVIVSVCEHPAMGDNNRHVFQTNVLFRLPPLTVGQ